MEIEKDMKNGLLFLSQSEYLTKVLVRFGFSEVKAVQVPHFKLNNEMSPKADGEELEMKQFPYSSIVGCLMYAMVYTRPDLASDVSGKQIHG